MKTILTFLFAVMIVSQAYTQKDTINTESELILINDNEISVDEKKDSTRIKIGKKGIVIIESRDGTTNIEIKNIDKDETFEEGSENDDTESDNEYNNEPCEDKSPSDKFKGHWAGFQIGLNNYVNDDFSMSLDNSMNYMDLNTGKSWNFSLNFAKADFGFGTDKIGIVTGLGIDWNNYHFDKENSIRQDSIGIVGPYDLSGLGSIQKNRLQTTYLTVPLLLEFQIPAGKKRVHFSFGPIGSLKLGSNTKIVYKDNGDRRKIKDKDDYSLSSLRYGLTARAGYRGLNLFSTYYLTPLFESNKGPLLYPFTMGLALIDF